MRGVRRALRGRLRWGPGPLGCSSAAGEAASLNAAGFGSAAPGGRRMSRLLPTAVVLTLIVGLVPPPMTLLASPIVAQGVNAPAGPTLPSTASPPGQSAPSSGTIVLNFEDAEIETVTRAVSEIVGFSYILAPDVRGKVTIRTAGAIRREDVFSVFLSILEVHGFTAVKAAGRYKLVRTETARGRPLPTCP